MNFKEYSKITFYMLTIIVFAIVGSVMFGLTFESWSLYGMGSLNIDYNVTTVGAIPTYIQVQRVVGIISLVLSIAASAGIIKNSLELHDEKFRKMLIYSGGFFSWIFLPFIIIENQRHHGYKMFWNYIQSENEDKIKPIDNKLLWKNITFKERFTFKSFATLFTWFVFILTTVGMVIMFYPIDFGQSDINPFANMMFNTFVFFTQWSNILIFFFLFIFIIKPNSIIFRKNTFLILITAWITIVGLVFWAYLFPNAISEGIEVAYPTTFRLVKTIWTHAINPTFFIAWSIIIMFAKPIKKIPLWNIIRAGLPFPLIYASIIFTMPFVARSSSYGAITNLNPFMSTIKFNSVLNIWEVSEVGSPLIASMAFVGLFAIFILFYFIYWTISNSINLKMSKKISNYCSC